MYRSLICFAAAAALAFGPQTARAQSQPVDVQPTTITFNGVVSSNVAQTIQVRDPVTNQLVPYTGPVPVFSQPVGQPVTISFNANLPTKFFFDSYNAALVASGQKALGADTNGIVPVTAVSNLTTGAPTGAKATSVTYSNGLLAVGSNADPSNPIFAFERLSLIYDLKTDTYSIDPSTNHLNGAGAFENSGVAGAGFTFDLASGTLVACTTNCAKIAGAGPGIGPSFDLVSGGDPGSITARGAQIFDTLGHIWGTFTMAFSGTWSLPVYDAGATQVPEPGMLGLFGAGVLVLPLRRWRARKKA
jgi:hypothetical protein